MRFVRMALFIFALVSSYTLLRSAYDLWHKGGVVEDEEERYARARYTNDDLRREYDQLQDPDYIEKQAREKLGLSRSGEAVVVIPPHGQAGTIETDRAYVLGELPVYEQWLKILF